MHVIVVGAGEVGTYVAGRLSREGHDVSVVELDANRLRQLNAELDVLTVQGSGSHPSVMNDAGVARCELVVALTDSDEVNLVASLIAKRNGVPRTIVRIESAELRGRSASELRQIFGADLVIDPDLETAETILHLLDYPGASEIAVMGRGEAIVIGTVLPQTAPLAGRLLSDVAADYEPDWEFIVGSVSRGEETIIPRFDLELQAGDLLRVVCKRRARRQVSRLLGLGTGTARRVMLLGGGRTAEILAARLVARGVEVVIVERDETRAMDLARKLRDVQVLQGNITDADLLAEANLGRFDVVAALTGEDESNILACLYAKSVGVGETIAVVHKLTLLSLLGSAGVDVSLSPRTATADGVMRFVHGDVAAVATFLQSEAEVLELEVASGCPADGVPLRELGIPKDVIIAAFVRDGKPQIARGRSRLRPRDHVIAFAMPWSVHKVNSLLTCEE